MNAAGDQTGKVRHVDQQVGTDRIGDLAEATEVPVAGVCRGTGDDQLRLRLLGDPSNLVVVEELVLAPHAIRHDLEPLARNVDRRSVRQVAAGGEVEAHEGVAWLEQRQKHRLVHLAAGIGLHVGERRTEQPLGALDGQRLGNIDELAATVVPLARIPLGILVREHGALRLEHGLRNDVLRRDQFDVVPLATKLARDRLGDLGVALGKAGIEEAGRNGISRDVVAQ